MRGGVEQRDAFAVELRRLCADVGLSLADLAQHVHVNRGYLGHVVHVQRWPSRPVAAALDRALAADGRLLAVWPQQTPRHHQPASPNRPTTHCRYPSTSGPRPTRPSLPTTQPRACCGTPPTPTRSAGRCPVPVAELCRLVG
ncbi:MAG: helix-turn-helix domain-containing protein [Actinomycetota bacterium]|nr:helix-turn-helix domain-containing protein [Actinomycetota bacterium]